jgi:hypothetical protein
VQISQMRNLADAAKEAGLKHAVFSAIEGATKMLQDAGVASVPKIGKYCVPHVDSKG